MLIFITRLFRGRRKKEGWPPQEPIAQVADEALMRLYAQGHHEAFEVLLGRHERGVYNFILRSTGQAEMAEDLCQEVFLRVIKSAPRYKESARFTTWLYTIARNICIDKARRRARHTEVSLNKPYGGDDGEEGRSYLDNLGDAHAAAGNVAMVREQFRGRLREALDALPQEQREVFLLREVSGLKFREIADVIGVPENTIKSRMRYALETLRGFMEEYRGYSFDRDEQREVGST